MEDKEAKWKGYTFEAYQKRTDEYGEPIYKNVTVYYCSNCGRRTVVQENYCPSCGCKMRKG